MNNIIWTHSEEDFRAWDKFLISSKRGHYLQASDWLKSYEVYGFNCELLLVKDEKGQIVGGSGLLICKLFIFKFCVVNCGPIIKKGHEKLFNVIVKEILSRSRSYNPVAITINFPILEKKDENLDSFCLDISLDDPVFKKSKSGNYIKFVSCINGFREVPLKYHDEINTEEHLFKNFNKGTRRDVRYSLNNNLSLKFAESRKDLKKAYLFLEKIAKEQNFSRRSWKDFEKTLINMVKNKVCIVPTCYHEDILKSVLIISTIGKRYSLLMAGSLRENPSLHSGRFIHFQILKMSIQNKFLFYDISVGGTKGVTKFKEGFGGFHKKFIGERTWIENSVVFYIYIKALPFLKKNKVFISKVLKYFR
tara:strand:+ start:527 stop:1615 length:1089 start_codon:yes stop_codon:yes gene_type:complete